MDKTVKCLLLKVDNVIVTEIIPDTPAEDGGIQGNLTPWPDITDQREMMIHSDSILTIVDPKEEIIEKYLELTA